MNHSNLNRLCWTLFISTILILLNACGAGKDGNTLTSITSPQGLIANSGSRIVELSWSGIPSAKSYSVYWSNNPNVSKKDATEIQTESPYYKHRGLINGLQYYYIVAANTANGETSTSYEVIGEPEAAAPPQPEKLFFTPGDQRVTIDFEQVPGASAYTIFWSDDSEKINTENFESANRIDGVFPPFVHSNLINGKPYYYRLSVSNEIGKTSTSNEFSATPQKLKPLAPKITLANADNGKLTLEWKDVSNAESFNLYWSTEPNVSSSGSVISNIQSPYIFQPENISASKHYYVKIQAINSAGLSELSNEVHFNSPNTAEISVSGEQPAMPSLQDTDGNYLVSVDIEDRQLTIDWSDIDVKEGQNFNLYWKQGTENPDNNISLTADNFDQKISNIRPPYTHISLQNNIYYYYRLSVIDDHGESELSELPLIKGKPEIVTPGVATGVTAIGGDNKVTISWNPVQRATGYNIEMADDDQVIDFTNVQSPFVVEDLENDKAYTFRVFVVSGDKVSEGSEPVESSPRQPAAHAVEVLTASPGNHEITLQWKSATPQNLDDEQEAVTGYQIYYRSYSGVSPENTSPIEGLTLTPSAEGDFWQATIPNLSNGQRYYFVVTAINKGGESPASTQVWAVPQESIPNAPRHVFAEAGDNQITIHFSGIDSETPPLYNLYWSKILENGRSETQVITNISEDPAYIFTDGDSNGTTYFFQVSATNPGGESVLSPEVTATPNIPKPSSMPVILSVEPGDQQVSLSWEESPDASNYHLYWSTDPDISIGKRAKIIVNSQEAEFNHTSLQNGEIYYYRLSAVNDGGEGPLSDIYVSQPQIEEPNTPENFQVSPGDSSAVLSWSETSNASSNENIKSSATNTDAAVQALSYDLFWHDDLSAPLDEWRLLQGVQPGSVINELTNGIAYYFKLMAVNAGGTSEPTEAQSITPVKPEIPSPNTPTGLKATAAINEVQLSWDMLSELNYTVYWSADSNLPFENGERIDNVSSPWVFQANSNLAGQSVYFQVTASSEGGESLPSNVIQATPIEEVIQAPVISSPPDISSAVPSVNTISLNWQTPENASEGVSYTLYWSTQSFSATELSTVNRFDNISPAFTHSDLSELTTYYYRLTATNPDTTESSASAIRQVTTLVSTPQTPTGLQVVAGDSVNTISWNASENATQYILEFSDNAEFTPSSSISINAPTTSYSHFNIANDVNVFYRVSATNSTGTSAPGETGSGTPQQINTNSKPIFGLPPTPVHNEGYMITSFTVSATDADGNDLVYSASGYPNGISFNTSTGTFSGTLSTDSGQNIAYTVIVTADDQSGESNAVGNVQFSWAVNDVVTDPSQSTLSISPTGNVTAGQVVSFTVIANDNSGNQRLIGGDAVSVSIQGANQGQTLASVQDNQDGSYQLSYIPTVAGQDNYTITLNGTNLNASSKVIDSANVDMGKTQLVATTGPFEVDDTVNITARLFDQFDNTTQANSVVFNITGTNAQNITANYNESTNIYSASYQTSSSGSDTLRVTVNNTQVNGLSLNRTTNPITTDANLSTALVSPATTVETGQSVTIAIIANDHRGIQRTIGGDTINVTITGANAGITLPAVQDNNNGTYEFSYTPINAGTDTYSITINNANIGGGPYSKAIEVTPLVLSKTQMSVTDGPFRIGDTVLLSAQVFDGADNPTTVSSLAFNISGANARTIAASYNASAQRYEANFQTVADGTDTFTITVNGSLVNGLSLTRTVNPLSTDAALSRAVVSPSTTVETGQLITITITANDHRGIQRTVGGDTVNVTITGSNAGITLPAVQDNNNGTYEFSYTPINAGTDTYSITINNANIGGGPYSKTITVPPLVLSSTQMSVTDGPFVAGATVLLSAQVFDGANNPTTASSLNFAVEGANAQTISATYNASNQHYEASIQVANAGTDVYTVVVNNTTVSSLSFTRTVTASTLVMTNTLFSVEPAGTNISTDETITISIITRDAFNNKVYDANNVVSIDLPYANRDLVLPPITDNLDGSYTLNYQPEKTGTEYINLDINTGEFTDSKYKRIEGGTAVLSTLEVGISEGPYSVLHSYRLRASLNDQFGNPTRATVIFNIEGANTAALNTNFTYNSQTSSYNNFTTFTPANQGTDNISVTVNDVTIDTLNEVRTIGPNQLPVANPGADFVVTRGTSVQLSAAQSVDPEGRNMSYNWSVISVPGGSSATLDDINSHQPTFVADQLGTYTFGLTVNDGFDTNTNSAVLNVVAKDTHTLDAPNTKATPYQSPAISVNSNGDMLAIWRMYNGRGYKSVFSYKPSGGNWSAEEFLSLGSNEVKLINDGQNFMVVYDRSYEVFAREFDGTSWSDEHSLGRYYYGGFDIKKTSSGYIFYGFYSYSTLRTSFYELNATTGLWEWSDLQDVSSQSGHNSTQPHFIENDNGDIMFTWSQRSYFDTGNVYELISVVNENGVWTQPQIHVTGKSSQIYFKTQKLSNGFLVTHYNARSTTIDGSPVTVYDIEANLFSNTNWLTPEIVATSRTPNYDVASSGLSLNIVWADYTVIQNVYDYNLNVKNAEFSASSGNWVWNTVQNLETGKIYIYSPRIISNGSNYLLSWRQKTNSGDPTNMLVSIFNNSTQSWGASTEIDVSNTDVGEITLGTNNSGYMATWIQRESSAIYSLNSNVYELNQATSTYNWTNATQNSIHDSNRQPVDVEILSNGNGYLLSWKQQSYESGNYTYAKYIATYGNPGASNSWAATQQIDGDGTMSSLNLFTTKAIQLPNGEYQIAWLEDVNSEPVLYTSNINGTNTLNKTDLIQNTHEGYVVDVRSITNQNGSTLVISKQYNAGKYQLYGQLYRNSSWEPQTLISNEIDTFDVVSIGAEFYVLHDTIATSSSSRNLYATTISETTGMSPTVQLNAQVFYRGSYSNWRVSKNQNGIAVIWGRNQLNASVYDVASGVWSTAEPLQSAPKSVSFHQITSSNNGFGVTWVSYDLTNNAYANVYANGAWGGEQLLENSSQQVGNRDYEGAPVIAANDNTYMAFWAQDTADNTITDIFSSIYNPATTTWEVPVKIGDAGAYQVYPSIMANSSDFGIVWNKYLPSGTNNGYYSMFYQFDTTAGQYVWTSLEKQACNTTMQIVNDIFKRSCSGLVQERIFNTTLNNWEWTSLPLNQNNGNIYNFVFNNNGDHAGTYSKYSSQLGRSQTFLSVYDATNGWDTGRVMNFTDTTAGTFKTFSTGDSFAYQWMQSNSLDESLLNALIMVDLRP